MTAPSQDGPLQHTAQTRLAIYGTLAPGRENHHQLAGLRGDWRQGSVRGRLFDAAWGAALGYPGLILDPAGPAVPVHLFQSADLPAHWDRLDAFEGEGYARVIALVSTDQGDLDACIYSLSPDLAAAAPPIA